MKYGERHVDSKDSADFIRIISEPDPGNSLYNISEFYMDGQKKLAGKTSGINPILLQGLCIEFFPNGYKKLVCTYTNNLKIGEAYDYFPNGKLYTVTKHSLAYVNNNRQPTPGLTTIISCNDSMGKALVENGKGHYVGYDDTFSYVYEEGEIINGKKTGEWKGKDNEYKVKFTELYNEGILFSGKAITDTGNESYAYNERHTEPLYLDDKKGFMHYFISAVHLFASELDRGVHGTAFYSYTIDTNGKVKNAKVQRSMSPRLDGEALRIINQSGKWEPAKNFGKPVEQGLVLPFTLIK